MKLPIKDKWNSNKDNVQYDPGMVAYLGLIFDPKRPCIDVGANVGKISRFLALRTTETIFSFEPSPSTYACLVENMKNINNVKLINKACGHINGQFNFVGDGTVTAHLSKGNKGLVVNVDVIKLDEYFTYENIGLIKIDVEGDEASVLMGARNLIKRTMPLIVLEVIDGHMKRSKVSRGDIFRLMYSLGYVRAVNKYGMKESIEYPTGASDIFFLPNNEWYAPNLSIGYNRIKGGECES